MGESIRESKKGPPVRSRSSPGLDVATHRFGPYGTVESQAGTLQQPFGFVGQLGYHTDPSGVVQVGIRSYLPEVGRWTQPDPTRQDANLVRSIAESEPLAG